MGPSLRNLVRGIGRWDLVALVINVVIGAGILGLPAKAFALVGTYSILAWMLCAVAMGLVAACFAEVGSRFAQTGGPYLYAHAAFGPATGFLVGWLSWLSRLFSFATIANLAITYAGASALVVTTGVPRATCIVLLSALLTLFVITGVRRATVLNNVLTVCKLLLLGGFVAVCLPFVEWSSLTVERAAPAADWQAAIMMMTFAFLGIESAMITSGEMKNPRRDVPFALGAALAVVALLYIAIQIVCIGALPDLAESERPMVDAAERVMGPLGAHIVNAGALITMFGTLFAILLTGSRLPFAFAEQGQLPAIFGVVHPRFLTPHVAILVTGICACLLALYMSFLGALVVSALTRLVGYATTCAASIVLRSRSMPADRSGFQVPGGKAVAVLGVAICLWLMLGSSLRELNAVLVLALAGALIFLSYNRVRQKRGIA